jgi:hypothetical protein
MTKRGSVLRRLGCAFSTMSRLNAVVCMFPLCVAAGCAKSGPQEELSIRLSTVGRQRHDHILVRVTATNTSDHPVVCDRELSAYMQWELITGAVSNLPPQKLAMLDKPRDSDFRDRFTTLQPGDAVVHDFELTYLVRLCSCGHSTSGPHHDHEGIFAESVGRFRIPQSERRVTVLFSLSRDPIASGAFAQFFGHRETELPPWPNNTVSNELTISLP